MLALDILREFEGFRETPYWDVNALRTGYGSDTVTLADGTVQRVSEGTRVTREDAERDLARRVQSEFLPRVQSAVGQEAYSRLSENQQAALASITYNYGSLPGSVAAAVRSGDPAAVRSAIEGLAGHNDGVNADRRRREAAIYAGENVPTSSGQSVATDQAPGGQTDYTRLAYAYANGRMTPEDMALYERGMAEGVFPRATRPEPPPEPVRPDPLAIYAAATQRNRVSELPVFQPFQLGGLR